jgi:hypothetical protein
LCLGSFERGSVTRLSGFCLPFAVDAFSWFLIQLWRCLIGYLSQHFGNFETEKHVRQCFPPTILIFEMEVF